MDQRTDEPKLRFLQGQWDVIQRMRKLPVEIEGAWEALDK